MPLGQGIPLLPPGDLTTLDLVDQRILPDSGIAVLAYTVPGGEAAPKIGFIKPAKAAAKKRAVKRVAKRVAVKSRRSALPKTRRGRR